MPKVTMPQLGESVAEGTIGKWLKNVGDHVDKYEPIVEVITDKVNAEVPSPFAGTLSEILVQEGETVPNDTEIAVIDAAGEGAEAEPAAASPGGAASDEAPAAVAGAEAVADEVRPGESDTAEPEGSKPAVDAGEGGHGPAGSDERLAPQSAGTATAATAAAAPEAAPATAAPAAKVPTPSGSSTAGSNGAGDVAGYTGRMTPAVRRLAREHSVDLAQIAGSGHDGRVTRDDIMKWVESGGASAATSPSSAGQEPAAGAPADPPAPPRAQSTAAPSTSTAAAPSPTPAPAATGAPSHDELKPMTPMRKAIARHMVESKSTAPHAYTTVEVDMSGVVALRDSVKRQYQEREGTALSFVAIVGKAVVEGLRRNPDLNAHWTEEGVMRRASVNLGVAVAVDDGLIVPVIKDADRYSIHGLNLWVQDYATRARANRLKMDDIQGGTFTLNNTGWFGSVSSQPIVNVPEIAILSMEAIVKRPVVVETPAGDTIGIRPMMNICVSFDHRGTDGAQIGRFVQDVKRWLESVDPQTPVW